MLTLCLRHSSSPGGPAPVSPSPSLLRSQDPEHREARLSVWKDDVCYCHCLPQFNRDKLGGAADTSCLNHPFISFCLGCPTRTLTVCAMSTWMRLQGGAVKVWLEPCPSEAGPSVLVMVFPRAPVTLSTLIIPLHSAERRGHPESSICCHPTP